MLAVRSWGAGPPLVLAHGFTQTGAFWDALATHFPGRRVVAPDLPGHGGSAAYAGADLSGTAALLGAAGGRADYVGYSLGGRALLHLALDRPELVHSLVLVGARPGLPSEPERAARAAADDREAFEAGETPVDEAADPEARRRAVHEQARAAIDEMRGE